MIRTVTGQIAYLHDLVTGIDVEADQIDADEADGSSGITGLTTATGATAANIKQHLYNWNDVMHEHMEINAPFAVVFCVSLFCVGNYILMNILVSVDRQMTNSIMAGTCVLVNIALNMCLIPHYGYLGAGTATVITEIVLFSLGLYYVAKYICKINVVAVASKPFISVAIMGTFIMLAAAKLNLAIVIFLSVLTYFTCLLLLRFFTKEDKIIFMHLSRK